MRGMIAGFLLVCCAGWIGVSCGAGRSSNEQKTLTEAINSKNTPRLIKELISQMKEELETDNDRFPDLIVAMENYTSATTDAASKAALHSMAAEMYNYYYRQNRWTINQRTAISGYIPDDIREWSANLFTAKIKEHIDLSLQPAGLLQQTEASRFGEMMEAGDDARSLRPSLYDFLCQRATELQPSADIYRAWLDFRRGQEDRKAALMVELDFLKYTYTSDRNSDSRAAYRMALRKLADEYAAYDYSIEIRVAQVELLDDFPLELDSPSTSDSIPETQYKLCKEGIRLYPGYARTGILLNRLAEKERPALYSDVKQTVHPDQPLSLTLTYKNIREVKVSIYESRQKPVDLANGRKELPQGKLIKEFSVPLHPATTYNTQDTVIPVSMELPGLYECVISSPADDIQTKHTVSVSRLMAVSRTLPTGDTEVMVGDLLSGKPIAQAVVTWFGGKRNDLQAAGSLKTDKDGLVILPSAEKPLAFQASLAGDESAWLTNIRTRSEYTGTNQQQITVSLFTDRSIYRPGQTLFFKGIAYVGDKDKPRVAANQTFSVILRDANHKEVTTKSFTTNAFGSFNGEYTLPKQGLAGIYSLSVENYAGCQVRVEEYKRPAFFAEWLPVKEEVAFGDRVAVEGRVQTFSGVSLQNGEVDWRIIRRPFLPLRMGGNNFHEEQVAQGKTTVSAEGTFSVSFRPEKKEDAFPQYSIYEVIATVTDSKGETQEARYSFPVGETSIVLSIDLPDQVEKTAVKASVSARLLNGESTSSSGKFTVFPLTVKENTPAVSPEFTEGEAVAAGHFASGSLLPPEIFSKLPSGRYRIRLKAADSKGRTAEGRQDFILYGKEDKRPPVFSRSWLVAEHTSCLPGEEAKWIFGASDSDAYVLYEIFGENKQLLLRRRIRLDNENRAFTLPFKEEYGDGVTASFTYIKNGEVYVTQVPVTRRQPDRRLSFRPETFRDRLLPGGRETWKFRITDSDSLAVNAEVLAAMYDKSLDVWMPHYWSFAPERTIRMNAPRFILGEGFRQNYQDAAARILPVKAPEYRYDQLDWQGMMRISRMYAAGAGSSNLRLDAAVRMKSGVAEETMAMRAEDDVADSVAEEETMTGGSASPLPSLRTNFNETAFFYPTLSTDEKGDFVLTFTVPESNTTWKLQAIAHTQEMKYGVMTRDIVTAKPLMVAPNLPRFLRQGDKATLSAQILNPKEKEINGYARIELFDPATDKPIVTPDNARQPFTLPANGQGVVQWTVRAPAGVSLAGVRITAETEEGSDGEQHLIPVLSNRILITESTPFYLLHEGERRIDITPSKADRQSFRLTLEVSGNPVWYAVQALPALTAPDNDNILSRFASYYGNTLASYIATSHPGIQKVIDQWAATVGDASTLLSNLERNEELKQILLEETPWVLEAAGETEQKQRLSLLFDLNRAGNRRETALRRLLDEQTAEGGWSWFKGFYPDRGITLSILQGMSRLVQMNAVEYGREEKEMQIRALRYLDQSIQKDYESLKKHDKDWEKAIPSIGQVEYLCVRSRYRDIPEPAEAREAIRFFTGRTEKGWNDLSLYGKGMAALLMHRNGNRETATAILAWLRKTATTTEEQGMFWANNRRGTSFYVSPVDVHCLLLSAFAELSPDTQETDRLKQWLLNQKRTQNWETVPSTLNAIYALLLTGSDWPAEKNAVTVRYGGQTYDTSGGEAGTGYLKKVFDGTASAPYLTVGKKGDAPAWGAVYNQYFTPVNQVEASKGVLNVEKKLFVETNSGTERQIRPVTAAEPLRTGDKAIIRLTIRTDRDMDYVMLKDLRAGCFEPVRSLSGYDRQNGLSFYRSPKDVSENFFFPHLPKGTFVVEYSVYVSRSGEYAGGISTVQCMYAPEFVSHTEGSAIYIKPL